MVAGVFLVWVALSFRIIRLLPFLLLKRSARVPYALVVMDKYGCLHATAIRFVVAQPRHFPLNTNGPTANLTNIAAFAGGSKVGKKLPALQDHLESNEAAFAEIFEVQEILKIRDVYLSLVTIVAGMINVFDKNAVVCRLA